MTEAATAPVLTPLDVVVGSWRNTAQRAINTLVKLHAMNAFNGGMEYAHSIDATRDAFRARQWTGRILAAAFPSRHEDQAVYPTSMDPSIVDIDPSQVPNVEPLPLTDANGFPLTLGQAIKLLRQQLAEDVHHAEHYLATVNVGEHIEAGAKLLLVRLSFEGYWGYTRNVLLSLGEVLGALKASGRETALLVLSKDLMPSQA